MVSLHQLFRDLLLLRLQNTAGVRLERSTSAPVPWFETHALLSEAIHHA